MRPEASTRARASLSRMSTEVSATGIEPRVPQKRTRMHARRLVPASRRPVEGRRGVEDAAASASRTVGKTSNTRLKWLISKISATIGCSDATTMRPFWALACRAGEHEAAQPGARDVLEAGEVEDDRAAVVGGAFDVRHEVGTEGVAVVLVEPAGHPTTSAFAIAAGLESHLVLVVGGFRPYCRGSPGEGQASPSVAAPAG